jgi:ferrous iron transport protein A
MANVLAFPQPSSPTTARGGATSTAPADLRLATAVPGQRVRIVQIAQEEEHAAWLRAVGMHEDAVVTVLRRAPFGGPIHLRSVDGGEFAIHRDLARCIHVAPVDDASRSRFAESAE